MVRLSIPASLRVAVALACLLSLPAVAVDVAAPRDALRTVPCSALDLPDLGAGAECAWFDVPENRAAADTVTLSLPVVILRSTGRVRADDAVLYLNGGPGIATVENAPGIVLGRGVVALREARDFVFFDQRGTGKSTPAICPGFDDALRRILQEAPPPEEDLRRKRAAAQACRDELATRGRDPASYRSSEIAEDAEALRRALGYRQWNLFATSYGSFPAFELARRYPASVRSLLLNSAYPPNSPNRAEQFSTTAEGMAALQARCDADDACRERHPDLLKDATDTVMRLERAPLKTPQGQLDGASFMRAMWTLLVQGGTAHLVPEFLRRAAAGDDATIAKVAAPFIGLDTWGTLSHAQQWLVACHDIYPRPSAPAVREAIARHPAFSQGVHAEEQDAVCDVLQPAHSPDAFYAATPVAVPALVYAGEYDPATPTSDARAAMEMLPNGTLVTVVGASHAALSTDDCTRGIGIAFIVAPTAAPDLGCLARRPQPTFADAAAFDAALAGE